MGFQPKMDRPKNSRLSPVFPKFWPKFFLSPNLKNSRFYPGKLNPLPKTWPFFFCEKGGGSEVIYDLYQISFKLTWIYCFFLSSLQNLIKNLSNFIFLLKMFLTHTIFMLEHTNCPKIPTKSQKYLKSCQKVFWILSKKNVRKKSVRAVWGGLVTFFTWYLNCSHLNLHKFFMWPKCLYLWLSSNEFSHSIWWSWNIMDHWGRLLNRECNFLFTLLYFKYLFNVRNKPKLKNNMSFRCKFYVPLSFTNFSFFLVSTSIGVKKSMLDPKHIWFSNKKKVFWAVVYLFSALVFLCLSFLFVFVVFLLLYTLKSIPSIYAVFVFLLLFSFLGYRTIWRKY